ncbi:MAG: DUF3298 and DUF4163 domain-containing protein [Armatimonadetes bacterium]|nr:DUF3298 and DUF4163 domain-containing protein [Armatimonadota bacterium]
MIAALTFVLLPPGSALTADENLKLSDERKGYWSVVATAAVPRPVDALTRLARNDVFARERKDFSEFLASAKNEVPDMKKDMPSAQYDYESDVRCVFQRPRLVSFQTSRYTYTAGAHGLGFVWTFNYGYVGGKPRRFGAKEAFVLDTSGRALLQRLLLGEAMRKEGTDWIENGMVSDFNRHQLDNFWVGKDGLSWEFAPYELGSYASGPFTLKLSWKDLQTILRKNGPLTPALPR